MSHWTTSGRSRLKAKQTRSFQQRAQMRANVVAPESIMVPTHHLPSHVPRHSNPNHPEATTSRQFQAQRVKRRLSYSNPIDRNGIRVPIGTSRFAGQCQESRPLMQQLPPQVHAIRRIRDPTAARYHSSRSTPPVHGHLLARRGSHVYPQNEIASYPRNSNPMALSTEAMAEQPFTNGTPHGHQDEYMHPLSRHSQQTATIFSPPPHLRGDKTPQELSARRQSHTTPQKFSGIRRFQKQPHPVDLIDHGTYFYDDTPLEQNHNELQPFKEHQRSAMFPEQQWHNEPVTQEDLHLHPPAIAHSRAMFNASKSDEPLTCLPSFRHNANEWQQAQGDECRVPEIAPTHNHRASYVVRPTDDFPGSHLDDSANRKFGDMEVGIPRFQRPSDPNPSIFTEDYDFSDQHVQELWSQIPSEIPASLRTSIQLQNIEQSSNTSSHRPRLRFFNNGVEVDADGTPLSLSEQPAMKKIRADDNQSMIVYQDLPDEDLWDHDI